jgi:hypothetical protein
MTTRRTSRLIWLLVSLFALRGLIPAGYMLDTTGGSLSIVMCGGNGPLKPSAPDPHLGHAGHEHHHAHGAGGDAGAAVGGGHEEHDKHSGSMCPFALAGSAPTPSMASPPIALAQTQSVDVVKVVSFHGLFGPSRAQQSRAPPYFS